MNLPGVRLDDLMTTAGVAREKLTVAAVTARSTAAGLASTAQSALLMRLPRKQADLADQNADPRGEIDWEKADRAAVLVTGLVAWLVDVAVVGTPKKKPVVILPWKYPGSPTTWLLHPKRMGVAAEYLDDNFECHKPSCKVPYDATHSADVDDAADDLEPTIHRVRSFGHESLLGWPVGMFDLMTGKGTYARSRRGVRRYHNPSIGGVNPLRAFQLQYRHMLSDVYTPAGLPVPFFSLMQLLPGRTPFSTTDAQERSGWAIVAKEMYRDGYELRHLLTMALVPATVEWGIRRYWRLTAPARSGEAADPARLSTMLVQCHVVALSGNLVKVAWVFKGEPTALNWAELFWMPAAAVLFARARRARKEPTWASDHEYTLAFTAYSASQPAAANTVDAS